MKLPKVCKIEAVASTDASRPVLHSPYLEVADGHGTLVATNGFALVALPVEVTEHDVSGWVSIPALVAARKFAKRSDTAEVSCNVACTGWDGVSYPRPHATPANAPADHIPSRFPNWRQVVPDKDRQTLLRVSLNPALLMDIAQALGAGEGVTLEFVDELDSIRVTGCGGKAGFGILMPMRTT